MVNLAFCRLDVFLSDQHWHSEAQHSSISIYIPSAGRSFMLEFLCWSSKDIWFGAFQIALVIRSSAVRISLSRRDLFWFEGGSELWEDHGSWFRFAGCWWWYHGGFFQTTAGVRSDHGRFIFWTFWVLLISSADSVYFCAFVLFWLEIRLITLIDLCFW